MSPTMVRYWSRRSESSRFLAHACAAGYADADFSCVTRLLRPTR